MKRIAILCDGTWNKLETADGSGFRTNIVRLWHALAETDADGNAQLPMYLPGVGNTDAADASQIGHAESGAEPVPAESIDSLEEWFRVKGGGAFGWEMDRKILEAYRFLADTWEPGDEIYVFGFSRGAYTARSLLGLIRNCGIVRGGALLDQNCVDALNYYRSRSDRYAPFAPTMRAIRSWLSPRAATDKDDLAERSDPGSCTLLKVAYLGVYDTVGALGVPSELKLLPVLFNREYRFHDTELSSMIRSARQVVALDERRMTYPPSLFDTGRLVELNDGKVPKPFRQRWFPGEHGAVGGGMPPEELGLGNASLLWIAEGAEAAGLRFEPEALARVRDQVDPMAPLRPTMVPHSGLDKLTLKVFANWHRPSLGTEDGVAPEAKKRWDKDGTYRPNPLRARAEESGWPE